MPRNKESDDESELEHDEGMNKWDIEEQSDTWRDEDQDRQATGRMEVTSAVRR
jgi:hypothetical protein